MEITSQDRINILVDMNVSMDKYSNSGGNYRPAIADYATYYTLLSLCEMDYNDMEPEYLWRKKPDEIMAIIIEENHIFSLEYGWDDLYESVREWIVGKGFVVHCDELDEEEYQQLMEAK